MPIVQWRCNLVKVRFDVGIFPATDGDNITLFHKNFSVWCFAYYFFRMNLIYPIRAMGL